MDGDTANTITAHGFTLCANGLTYLVNTELREETISIRVKRQLCPFNFEATYTLEELQKVEKVFYMYDYLEDAFNFIRSKLNDKKAMIYEGDESVILRLIMEIDQKERFINLTIDRNPENNINLIVNDMSIIIQDLMEKVKLLENPSFHTDSKVLRGDEIDMVKRWISAESNVEFSLLYKGCIHGDTASDFHSRVDNKGATICFVETEGGRRFGGYTTVDWDTSSGLKKDADAFVFSLDHKRKFQLSGADDGIYCDEKTHISFGNGDIAIKDGYGKKPSVSDFPKSYGVSEDYGDYKPNTMLSGTHHYRPKYVEVFAVSFN
jgi:hypothetical protein